MQLAEDHLLDRIHPVEEVQCDQDKLLVDASWIPVAMTNLITLHIARIRDYRVVREEKEEVLVNPDDISSIYHSTRSDQYNANHVLSEIHFRSKPDQERILVWESFDTIQSMIANNLHL